MDVVVWLLNQPETESVLSEQIPGATILNAKYPGFNPRVLPFPDSSAVERAAVNR